MTDLCFSPDARRLYAASQDGCLRVWDLATAKCLDWVAFSAHAKAHAKARTAAKGKAGGANKETNKEANKGSEKSGVGDGATDRESDSSQGSSEEEEEEEAGGGLGPATSVTVCPTGEFICTAHAGQVGLQLWRGKRFK